MSAPTSGRVRARIGAGLFLSVTCAGVLMSTGSLRSADYIVAFSVAGNLLGRGSPEANPIEGHEDFAVLRGPDGRPYCRFGVGHSLLGVPAWLLGTAVGSAWDGPTAFLDVHRVSFADLRAPPDAARSVWASLTNAFVLGLLALVLHGIGRRVGLPARASVLAALAGTVATPLFYLSTDLTAEPAAALCLALVARGLLDAEAGARSGRVGAGTALGIGLALGAGVLLKVAHAVLIPVGLAAFALAARGVRPRPRAAWAAVAIGCAAGLAGVAGWNLWRFGTPLTTGYTDAAEFTGHVLEGAAGQWVSPGHGILVFFPLAVAAVAGARTLWAASRPLAVLAYGSLAALWALYSPWHMWEGGWTWGPRLQSPALPLLAPAAVLWVAGSASALRRRAVAVLLATSAGMALLGFMVDTIDYCFYLWRVHGDAAGDVMRWSVPASPLAAYWSFPSPRVPLIATSWQEGFPWWLRGVLATALAGAVAGLAIVRRGLRLTRC